MEQTYDDFLKTKIKNFVESGFEVDLSVLNDKLFDFQKYAIKTALSKGRFALFEDCGLGKTFQQMEWARILTEKYNSPVLILAPLAVVNQTIQQGNRFGIKINKYEFDCIYDAKQPNILISNYDQLKNIDCSVFIGVVLDESSILKGRDGATSSLIISSFKNTPYKLACTATPSPNDHMELGQHSEFLGAMSYLEMLAMFFVHDGGETSKWRLRKHATDVFWKYVCSWSLSIDNPKTLGFDGCGYELPEIEFVEHLIPVENNTNTLFGHVAVSATDIHQDLNRSFDLRMEKTIELVENSNEQWIVWCLRNKESDYLSKKISNSINVQGSDSPEYKSKHLNGFADNEFKCLITKTSIASFGMNYQNSFNMVFTSYDFKFESFYQAVRRQYRFGQTKKVTVHLLVPESQLNVRKSILEKEQKHKNMISEMAKYSSITDYKQNKSKFMVNKKNVKTKNYHVINGDCVQETKNLDDNVADLVVFSPPFAELYVYSDSPNDMGNVSDYNEFEKHFKFLIPELKRVLKSGRICAVHCMDLPIQKGKEGYIGLRDFSGMLIDWFQNEGFIYHSRATIWKNPVTEMQRTKALGLLHKTIKKDSSMSRVGIPDYVLFFRNEGENLIPIEHQDKDSNMPNYLPVDLWQKYASPVWYDIDYSRTLQYRSGRDGNDEKHICPLQLDTIERCIHLYSNEGETVLSPFGGIGSEGFQALKMNRKSISIELKESYFNLNEKNHRECVEENNSILTLF
jgi:DNA modification methylase